MSEHCEAAAPHDKHHVSIHRFCRLRYLSAHSALCKLWCSFLPFFHVSRSRPLNPAERSGERCKLPQWCNDVWALAIVCFNGVNALGAVLQSPDSVLNSLFLNLNNQRWRGRPPFWKEGRAVAGNDRPMQAIYEYRKLAPNPSGKLAMQWIERTLKLSANIGKLSQNHFTNVSGRPDAGRRMISRDPQTKVHEIRGKFRLARPQRRQMSSPSDKKCARYPLWKNFASRKSMLKFTLGHQICHQSIGCAQVSIATLCSNFVSEISLYTVSQKTSHLWLAITLSHTVNFWHKCYRESGQSKCTLFSHLT